jgi:peptide/nickel transport system permease protein
MLRSVLRKVLILAVSLLFANFVGFTFATLVSPLAVAGNPYESVSTETYPLLPYYAAYFQGLLLGDFGSSNNGEPVLSVIARVGVVSLGLLGIALLLSILAGVALGRLSVRSGKAGIAPWMTVLSTVGLASPAFYTAVLLIFLVLQIVLFGPFSELTLPFMGFGWDAHLVLPVLALAIQPTVKIARLTGGLLSEEMEKPYVIAARGFGFKFTSIKRRYAFRSILSGVVLIIASSTRLMVAELIIIERLFNWPGFGRLVGATLSLSHGAADYLSPPMMAMQMTVLVAFFLLIDLFATLFARALDPRLRVDRESHDSGGKAA